MLKNLLILVIENNIVCSFNLKFKEVYMCIILDFNGFLWEDNRFIYV